MWKALSKLKYRFVVKKALSALTQIQWILVELRSLSMLPRAFNWYDDCSVNSRVVNT